MNFLCILQVSRIVFALKTNSYNYFSISNLLWTGPRIPEKSGFTVKEFLRLGNSRRGRRVIYEKVQGLFTKIATAKMYSWIWTVGLETSGCD
jgi:hypothetical protein